MTKVFNLVDVVLVKEAEGGREGGRWKGGSEGYVC